MDILDNQNVIAQRDTQDALGLAAETTSQLVHDFEFSAPDHADIHAVVFAGMGGSALQAEFVKTWPELNIPYVISKDYELPAFINEHTLVIVSSYSGNTEETLSALDIALQHNAQIVVTTGGGKLQEAAEHHNLPHIIVPKAVQPRMAVFYAFRALLEALVAYGLAEESSLDTLQVASSNLQQHVVQWTKDVETENNPAKQLALKLMGKTPIIYSGPKMAPAAYKWKISFNESAKNTSWYGTFPEFNHNEFIGWSSHPVEKPFAVIDLHSNYEHPRTKLRFEVTDRLLSGMRPKAIPITAEGESVIEQMLYLTLLGDFVSIYLGLLNGVDPSPVALVEKFKKELDA
ncbi:MAG: bifunctional phosphoglucose/phosphomannose isomerase [Candidatus Saccharimonadales bacterium]